MIKNNKIIYSIKNTFIDISSNNEYELKKIKSLNDLFFLIKLDDEIVKLKNNYLEEYEEKIEKYTNILYVYIKNKYYNKLKNKFKIFIEKNTINYNKHIDELNIEYENIDNNDIILSAISDIFIKKTIIKNSLFTLIKELKEKINTFDEKLINSKIGIEFINFLDLEINRLIIDKGKNINLSSYSKKDKLKEQYNLNILLQKVYNSYLKPYLDNIKHNKEVINNKKLYIIRKFIEFKKTCDDQIELFIKNYIIKIRKIIKENWKSIIRTNEIKLNLFDTIYVGDLIWDNELINISTATIIKLYP